MQPTPRRSDAPFKTFQGDYLTANTVSECNDSAAVMSKTLFDELGADAALITPHGTGPFIVTNWSANERIELRANNDYWDDRPHREPGPHRDSRRFRSNSPVANG